MKKIVISRLKTQKIKKVEEKELSQYPITESLVNKGQYQEY